MNICRKPETNKNNVNRTDYGMSFGVFILAGGNGSRIGQKKAFLKLGDDSLVINTHNLASELTSEIVIVINGLDRLNEELGSLPSTTKVIDDLDTNVGPMMGLYSGLKHSFNDYILVLPCDAPFMNIELLRYLLSISNGYDAVIPRWENGFIEPLHSVYRADSSLKAIEEALQNGERSVLDLIKRLDRVKYVPVEELKKFDPELLTFRNINYPEDYQKALDVVEARKKLNR